MDKLSLAAFQGPVNEAAERSRALIGIMEKNINIDPRSGRADVGNPDAIISAYAKFLGDDAKAAGEEVVAMVQDGFFQLPGADEKQTIAMPWRALERRDVAGMLGSSDWQALGFRPLASTDSVRKLLGSGKFGDPPPYLFEDGVIERLGEWAARRNILDFDPLALPRAGGGGGGGGAGGGGGSAPPPPPARGGNQGGNQGAPPIPQQTQNDIMAIIKGTAECLMNASWSIEGVWGVRICLDRKCADKIEAILLGQGGTTASAMIGYFLANFGKLTWKGVLTSAGGWVALALLHFSLYWGLLIRQNKTANGVCLVHVWPWWSGLTGGIFHGWAQGR